MEGLKLNPKLGREQLKAAAGRYHYGDAGLGLLYEVYGKMEGLLSASACYVLREREAWVVLTLGEGPDRLQREYLEKELLVESYMAECLCGELLRQAYRELNQVFRERHGLYAVEYLFPGQHLDLLEWEEKIFSAVGQEGLSQIGVRANKAGALMPRQSVVCLVRLSEKEAVCRSLCEGCREGCPWRWHEECEKGEDCLEERGSTRT